MTENLGAVAIGRNEGPRLVRCLNSLSQLAPRIVYVDSGSTDSSLEVAASSGAEIVELDMSIGFTAARARNVGWRRLLEIAPTLEYIQFVDGDCELFPDWLEAGVEALKKDPQLAIVSGRRRERFPEQTVYNRLADMEWNTLVGESDACGGNIIFRVQALLEVNGYNDALIAGEEPEMCVRLRAKGWRIRQIDTEMSWHDMDMKHFWQWYRRTKRAGHAFAEGFAMHGAPPENHYRRDLYSVLFWGFLFPILLIATAPLTTGYSLLGFLTYVLMSLKVAYRRHQTHGEPYPHCLLFGLSCALGKFPQCQGVLMYWMNRIYGRHARIIEYKTASAREKFTVPG